MAKENQKDKNGLNKGLVQRLMEQVQKQDIRLRVLEKLAGIAPPEVQTEDSSNPPNPPDPPPHH